MGEKKNSQILSWHILRGRWLAGWLMQNNLCSASCFEFPLCHIFGAFLTQFIQNSIINVLKAQSSRFFLYYIISHQLGLMLIGHCLKIEMVASDIQRYFYLLSERLWNSLWCGSCGHRKTSTGAEDGTPLWNLSANCAGTVSGVYCMSHFIWEIACFNALHVKLVTGIFSDDISAAHRTTDR